MKVLLDSTYLFPALDINITEGWSKADLMTLLQNKSFTLYYTDLSLFEMYAKVMRLIIQEKLNVEIESVQRGLQGILNSPKLYMVNWWDHLHEIDVVLKLKEIHSDSIDCTLFYLAVVNCDIFATFDNTLIKKIKEQQFIHQFIQETNPRFKIWLGNLAQEPMTLFP